MNYLEKMNARLAALEKAVFGAPPAPAPEPEPEPENDAPADPGEE